MASKQVKKTAGIADAAVQKATGKSWKEWCTVLDKAGARKLDHKGIVAIVRDQYGVGPWWQQMVTVGYEQARGLRQKHERPEGFQIGRSKTLAVPLATLYTTWKNKKRRDAWLGGAPLTIRKATADKSLRITWEDGATSVEVNFYPKGASKSQVTVQHSKLPNAKAGEKMKAFWSRALDQLQKSLAKPS